MYYVIMQYIYVYIYIVQVRDFVAGLASARRPLARS